MFERWALVAILISFSFSQRIPRVIMLGFDGNFQEYIQLFSRINSIVKPHFVLISIMVGRALAPLQPPMKPTNITQNNTNNNTQNQFSWAPELGLPNPRGH